VTNVRAARRAAPYLAVLALMGLSAALRLPVLHAGHEGQDAYNTAALGHLGGYSDVASLYFRDHLWRHQLPYIQQQFEYPVLLGAFMWLLAFVHSTVTAYFLTTAAALAACAVASVWLVSRLPRGRPLMLALAPAVAFTGTLNWDFLAIALTLLAIELQLRRGDSLAGAALAAATWVKFFPIVCLPVFLAYRLAKGGYSAAARTLAGFLAVSLAVNLPVILWSARAAHRWAYFFQYNAKRTPVMDAWLYVGLSGRTISLISLLLLAPLVALVTLIVWREESRGRASLVVGCCAALAAAFATAKVYNPQYALWIMALLAAAGAPWWLAFTFIGADAAIFVTHLAGIGPSSTFTHVRDTANVVRQLVTVVICFYLLLELTGLPARRVQPAAASGAGGAR
jgi:uncharacterized membrane protein